MDASAETVNVARWFALAAAACSFVFVVLFVAGSLTGEDEFGFGGSIGVAVLSLALFLTPMFTVFSVVAGMIQIGMRKAAIEHVGKWWALAVSSLAVAALAIGLLT